MVEKKILTNKLGFNYIYKLYLEAIDHVPQVKEEQIDKDKKNKVGKKKPDEKNKEKELEELKNLTMMNLAKFLFFM